MAACERAACKKGQWRLPREGMVLCYWGQAPLLRERICQAFWLSSPHATAFVSAHSQGEMRPCLDCKKNPIFPMDSGTRPLCGFEDKLGVLWTVFVRPTMYSPHGGEVEGVATKPGLLWGLLRCGAWQSTGAPGMIWLLPFDKLALCWATRKERSQNSFSCSVCWC